MTLAGNRRFKKADFVAPRSRARVDAVECKWSPAQFDPSPLKVFRKYYPKRANYLICPLSVPGYVKKADDLDVYVCHPGGWLEQVTRFKK